MPRKKIQLFYYVVMEVIWIYYWKILKDIRYFDCRMFNYNQNCDWLSDVGVI